MGAAAAADALAARGALARALRPALPVLLRREGGRRAALGGTIAHPERVPYDAALRARARLRERARASTPSTTACGRTCSAAWARSTVPLTLAWPEHDRLVARPRERARDARASSSCAAAATCRPGTTREQVAGVLLDRQRYSRFGEDSARGARLAPGGRVHKYDPVSLALATASLAGGPRLAPAGLRPPHPYHQYASDGRSGQMTDQA